MQADQPARRRRVAEQLTGADVVLEAAPGPSRLPLPRMQKVSHVIVQLGTLLVGPLVPIDQAVGQDHVLPSGLNASLVCRFLVLDLGWRWAGFRAWLRGSFVNCREVRLLGFETKTLLLFRFRGRCLALGYRLRGPSDAEVARSIDKSPEVGNEERILEIRERGKRRDFGICRSDTEHVRTSAQGVGRTAINTYDVQEIDNLAVVVGAFLLLPSRLRVALVTGTAGEAKAACHGVRHGATPPTDATHGGLDFRSLAIVGGGLLCPDGARRRRRSGGGCPTPTGGSRSEQGASASRIFKIQHRRTRTRKADSGRPRDSRRAPWGQVRELIRHLGGFKDACRRLNFSCEFRRVPEWLRSLLLCPESKTRKRNPTCAPTRGVLPAEAPGISQPARKDAKRWRRTV